MVIALLVLARASLGQDMYRCVAPNGSVSFQDKPCAAGARQSKPAAAARAAPAAGPRMRPEEGLDDAQRRDYEALMEGYVAAFRLLGRAKACGHDVAVLDTYLKEVRRRHGEKSSAFTSATLAVMAGEHNMPIGMDRTPPPPEPCDSVRGRLAHIHFPDIPPSLVLREGQQTDFVLKEGKAHTGPYRFVRRASPGRAAAEYLLVHRGKVAYRSPLEFNDWALHEGRTPVLVLNSIDKTRKCPGGDDYMTWFLVSLPASGDPVVSRLDADCMVAYPHRVGDRLFEICVWVSPEKARRPSRLYRIDAAGRPVPNGEMPAGTCPN